ncbi:alpha-xylosidase [Bacteroidales bacterium]|nr:alpha-xylosidase [Bacteroidales bacterium]
MSKRKLVLLLLVGILVTACNETPYQKTSDGVIVSLPNSKEGEVKNIRLQVVTDDIIHVTATPADYFPQVNSLIATYILASNKNWDASEDGEQVILQTATTKALISLTTGEISFTDLEGNVLLKENEGGGKTFQAVEIDGHKAYAFRQVFESPDDEAFYGLGQHQADEFNYKGKNEILFQYNTKVSVPFIVSNKNYGILWDNYSVTKFGDPRDYQQMNQFKLYDKHGNIGGLSATYMQDQDPSKIFVERQESVIDYENLETVNNFPNNFPFNNAAIAWEGEIEASESGLFRFILYYAGYTKVFIDGEPVVAERWRTAWNPNSYKFAVTLSAGQKHKIKMEWKPDGGVSYISLKALSPVDDREQNKLSFSSEMGKQLDYYFIRGNNADEVIKSYRTITGKAQVMPKWSMGFWQSRERYKTQEELIETLKEFRKRNIPIDNIVQDWSYWKTEEWGSHEFDPVRFPDPAGMVQQVHDMNARLMISVWPKFYHTTEHYKQFDEKGWMYPLATKDSIRDWIGKGYIGSFYDTFDQGARQLFWDQMNDKLYSKGIDAWWMDASEPDILTNASMEYRKRLMNPTALGSSTEYFNAYGLMNAKGIYEGQRATNDVDRVYLLTRSGFAGSQKYAAVIWSGDIGTRWEDMKTQISAGLNFSISGNPYWTMDNGGFCVEKRYENAKEGSEDLNEWRELNTRWHQFGAFVPMFRTHGQFPFREAWNIAPDNHPAYKSIVYYNELRYRLMPYIYTLAGKCYFEDYTIMRPLVMDFASDKKVLSIGDQYMFGPSIMACPVYQYKARSREVYFPNGSGWYDLYTGKHIAGGQKMSVDAPYERIPLFVREGSIIPTGEIIQNTTEPQTDLTLWVYAGKDATFALYEDENTNYNYEKGAFANTTFSYNEQSKILTISEIEGGFEGMIKERKINIVLVDKNNPRANTVSNTGISIEYKGVKQEIQL